MDDEEFGDEPEPDTATTFEALLTAPRGAHTSVSNDAKNAYRPVVAKATTNPLAGETDEPTSSAANSRLHGVPSKYCNNPLRPGETVEAGTPDSLAPLREMQELARLRQEGESMASLLASRKKKQTITRTRTYVDRVSPQKPKGKEGDPPPKGTRDEGVQCTLWMRGEPDDAESRAERGEAPSDEWSDWDREHAPLPTNDDSPTMSRSRSGATSTVRFQSRRSVSYTDPNVRYRNREVTTLEIDNPREFFLARAESKVAERHFADRTDELYSTLFVRIFRKLRFASVNRTEQVRTLPRVSVLFIIVVSLAFSFLICDYGTDEHQGPSTPLSWFVPRFVISQRRTISSMELETWGAATRCAIVERGEGWRVFASPLLHSTSNQFCANIIGLFVWGQHMESRYGSVRYVAVTLLSLLGGTLLGLVWYLPADHVVGADGAVAAHANMFLLDTLLNSKEKMTSKVFFGGVTLAFLVYALVTNSRNTIPLYIGGIIPTFFLCYVFQTHFASERVEVILCLGSLCATIVYFLLVPVLLFAMPRGGKCSA